MRMDWWGDFTPYAIYGCKPRVHAGLRQHFSGLPRHPSGSVLCNPAIQDGEFSAQHDQLIGETLARQNSMKITALFVVDKGRPVGIVHIHDLLRAGAA